MNPSLNMTDLRKGDILVLHSQDKEPTEELLAHVAMVAGNSWSDDASNRYTRPYIFEMKAPTGHCLNLVYPTNGKVWSVYRLVITESMEDREETEASKLLPDQSASLGYIWIFYKGYQFKGRHKVVNPGSFSIFSGIAAYMGSSDFSAYAQAYAHSLWKNNRSQPPAELRNTSRLFSGAICTYLPIALYQAVMGLDKSFIYMALNARQCAPRDLTKYLAVNRYWTLVGTVSGVAD
ncbi:hypothetical protein [Endozoicomonas euniceicola]|uniref:Uncharacterized protein n=1 Tax=Endozoicomonas euniceicola TaxID=1234143 RepID=A0ABY6GYG4_9GAMM|nr:hypothetical protein [Endozoicomonas euniceicola]UYM16954.1 hypothetical protein NX720_03245 [Endozoicomonas euniceicola]